MKSLIIITILTLVFIIGCGKDKSVQPIQEAPSITLISPSNGDKVKDTVIIEATASDNKGVIKVEFYIDAILRHTVTVEPYEFIWNCMEEADSSKHTIYAKSYDGDGNSTASSVVTIMVDYSIGPPSPVVLNFVNPSLTDSNVICLGWTENQDVDFNFYRVYRSLMPVVTESSILVREIKDQKITSCEDSGLTTQKEYYYRVFVYDEDSLFAGSNEMSILLVWEGPNVSLENPNDGDSVVGIVPIIASASDNNGLIKVEFYIDGILRRTDLLEPFKFDWNCMEEENGSHHIIYAKAYDIDGYVATTLPVTVTVSYSYGPPFPVTLNYVNTSLTDSTVLYLGWTESQAVDFNSYRIYRSQTTGVSEVSDLVAEIISKTTNTYTDSGLNAGQTYYYRIFVYDNDGLFAGSNELSGTPSSINTGYALAFDGVDDISSISDNAVFDFSSTNKLTIEFWMKISNYPSVEAGIINKWGIGSDEDDEWGFTLESNKEFRFGINSSSVHGSPNTELISNTLLEKGTWYHVAVVWNGLNRVAQLYLDGNIVDSDSSAIVTILNTSEPIRIGGYVWPSAYYNGVIDEVRIWNIARTEAQIQTTMHTHLTGNETGLVGYWTFDEGIGQVIIDHSGKGNNGQLGSTLGSESNDPTWIESDAPIY